MEEVIVSRYSRQAILPQLGSIGQGSLLTRRVLVVGAGGTGSTLLMYLAASGIATDVVDNDVVERSNLHRQIIHSESKIGLCKAASASSRMSEINSSVRFKGICERLTTENAAELIVNYDLIIDATDNFEARYIINDACILLGKPFITSSAVGFEGQITVIYPFTTACFRCLNPEPSVAENCRSCANAGVLGPVPGLMGCLSAIEAMKVIAQPVCSDLKPLTGRQLFYNGLSGQCFSFQLPPRDLQCAVCGEAPKIRSMGDCARNLAEFKESMEVRSCSLPAEHSASPQLLNDALSRSAGLAIVLDVRSRVQFQLAKLKHDNLRSFDCLDDCVAASSEGCVLVNVPLVLLKGGARQEEEERIKVFDCLTKLFASRRNPGTGKAEIYILCRRGIDSASATSLLLQNEKLSSMANFINVSGGLTSWTSEVDPSFLMY